MKSIIIFYGLFVVLSCKAQSPIYTKGSGNVPSNIPNNAYIKDTNNILNKFIGTWKYENNGKVFTINLQKSEMIKLINYYVDELNGYYKYTDGSLTIVDTSNYPINKSKLTGAWLWENNPDKVSLIFSDPERDRLSCKVTLTYSNQSGVEKLHWDLKVKTIFQQKIAPGVTLKPGTDVRVPTNVELIKQ